MRSSHQNWHELLDSKQGYDHAKFERPKKKKKPQNPPVLTALSNQKRRQLPLLNMCQSKHKTNKQTNKNNNNSGLVVIYFTYLTIFQRLILIV